MTDAPPPRPTQGAGFDMKMHPEIAFATPADKPAWQRWLVYSPLARIAIFFILLFVLGYVLSSALTAAGVFDRTAPRLEKQIGNMLVRGVLPLIAYLLLVRGIERRRPCELTPRRWLPDATTGIALGTAIISATVGIAWLAGSFHVIAMQAPTDLPYIVLVAGIGAGIGEEIIARGVLFRILEEGLGTLIALLVSAAYFGYGHINNPHSTAWSAIAIAVEAGLLLGMLYHVTRSLTLCMGVHAAWNVVEGGVFGIPVSGTGLKGWLVSESSGPTWLTGGEFGIEASVIALGVCSIVTLALFIVALRRRSLVAPFWLRGDGSIGASASLEAAKIRR